MTQQTDQAIEPYKISQFGEPYLYSVNRLTFESKSSDNIFSSTFKNRLQEKDTFYIVLGTDSGLLVDNILEKGLPYGSKYIFIELPEVIEAINTQLTFTKWDESIAICTLDEWQNVAESFNIQSYLFTEKIQYLKSISASDGYVTNYYELDSNISLTLESLKHKTMVSLSRSPFFKRQIENISENQTPANVLVNQFNGQNCIILGGGPSLDESINWLSHHHGQIVIIAVSRVIKKLLQVNIVPDIVVSVDPHDISFDVSRELLLLPENTIFLHSNYVVPGLLSQWRGRSLYCANRFPWVTELNTENINLAGPTVTNAAIGAAIDFGFQNIYLTGVDLCFAADGKTHASGSNEDKVGPMLGFKGQWVENYAGEIAETTNSFLHATYIINEQAKHANGHGIKLANLSLNAAKIEAIPFQKIDDVVLSDTLDKKRFVELVPLHKPENKAKKNNAVISELERFKKRILEVEKIALKALEDNTALYKEYVDKNRHHIFKLRLDKAEAKLNERYEQAALFIKKFGIKHFIKTVQTDTEQEWSNEKLEEVGQTYYQAFIDTIGEIKPLLNFAIDRAKSRASEANPKTDVLRLIEQWSSDKQFGRALLFKTQHEDIYQALPSNSKNTMDNCLEKFNEIMRNTDTQHARRSKSLASLQGVDRKIVFLFKQNKANELELLHNNLKGITNSDTREQAAFLAHLSHAYLAALKQNIAQAYDLFMELTPSKLGEDEWVQIVNLAINVEKFDIAEQYLALLSERAPQYTPHYASTLKLNNKIADAFNVYLDYLEAYPNDTQCWLALGKLCIEQNSAEHAQLALNQVLQNDPGNVEASFYLKQLDT